MSKWDGISYMRTTREKTAILYDENEKFTIGGSKVLRSSKDDKATLIAAGITLQESLKAYEELKKQNINVRVIDLYSVKPVDEATLKTAAKETGLLITVEDHWPEGGIGDAVLSAFAAHDAKKKDVTMPKFVKIAVGSMPGSGTPEELMDAAGISANKIVAAVKAQLG
jgi:transketolase